MPAPVIAVDTVAVRTDKSQGERCPEASSLIEVFSSIQGEGPSVGCRQIFIRFPSCNLRCAYCDTPFLVTPSCQFEIVPGCGRFEAWENPVALDRLLDRCRQWLAALPHAHQAFSITGGEPLLHGEILAHWLPRLRNLLPVHLETNGTLPEALAPLIPWLDGVMMDVKLASQTGVPTPWATHEAFLRCAVQTGCAVKMVVGRETTTQELEQVGEMIARVAPQVPVILQPRTIDQRSSVPATQLLTWQGVLSGYQLLVRVIPQTHCFLNAL
ncbi:MAG: 7-carboxy-7-deazaguanine synthase QueE [Desulfuromonadaceae bacterium]|nr:7-carboxy-7-deazaguanine synthase QueE [Desulfuromonadaceae bacterium]